MSLRIQKALKAEGFDPGPLDGVRGDKTRAALRQWSDWANKLPKGIDISAYQPVVDWVTLSIQISFVAIRATVSLSKDTLFAEHWANAKRQKILRSAYHFFAPWRDAKEQAQLLWSRIEKDPGELPITLDVEAVAPKDGKPVSAQQLIDGAGTMVGEVTRLSGRKPIFYTYSAFAQQYQLGRIFGNLPLWIADYREGPPTIEGTGWSQYVFHQHLGDTGRIEGVKGACDQDRFRGTREELLKLVG